MTNTITDNPEPGYYWGYLGRTYEDEDFARCFPLMVVKVEQTHEGLAAFLFDYERDFPLSQDEWQLEIVSKVVPPDAP